MRWHIQFPNLEMLEPADVNMKTFSLRADHPETKNVLNKLFQGCN